VAAVSDDNIRYINTRVSCNSVVLHSEQPNTHVFVSCGWLWWIIRKIFRQVVNMFYVVILYLALWFAGCQQLNFVIFICIFYWLISEGCSRPITEPKFPYWKEGGTQTGIRIDM